MHCGLANLSPIACTISGLMLPRSSGENHTTPSLMPLQPRIPPHLVPCQSLVLEQLITFLAQVLLLSICSQVDWATSYLQRVPHRSVAINIEPKSSPTHRPGKPPGPGGKPRPPGGGWNPAIQLLALSYGCALVGRLHTWRAAW